MHFNALQRCTNVLQAQIAVLSAEIPSEEALRRDTDALTAKLVDLRKRASDLEADAELSPEEARARMNQAQSLLGELSHLSHDIEQLKTRAQQATGQRKAVEVHKNLLNDLLANQHAAADELTEKEKVVLLFNRLNNESITRH